MKRQIGSVLLSCAVGAALLGGCTVTISPAASGASSDSAVQSEQETEAPSSNEPAVSEPTVPEPTAPEKTASEQAAQPTASPESPPAGAPEESSALPSAGSTPADDLEYTDLSFLTEEQRHLYSFAYEMSPGLYGMGGNLMYLWRYWPVRDDDGKCIVVNGNYVLYGASYNTFSNQIHLVFTDNCLSETDYDVKFIDYNGSVALDEWMTDDMVEGTTSQVRGAYPDTYRLVSSTENEVIFTLISHYDRNGWNGIDDPIDVYTIEYPIRMINTDAGWRMDEFHTTMFG